MRIERTIGGGRASSSLVEQARELRRRQTEAEKVLWQRLRSRRFLGLKFRRQHQFGNYIADFYCHEAQLVVELDGEVHDDEEVQKLDRWREENLESSGLKIVRIPNRQVLEHTEIALNKIKSAIDPK